MKNYYNGRLFSQIILITIGVGTLTTIPYIIGLNNAKLLFVNGMILVVGDLLLLISYYINRKGKLILATFMTCVFIVISLLLLHLYGGNQDPEFFVFLITPILFATLFLEKKVAIIFNTLIAGSMFLAPVLGSEVSYSELMYGPFTFVLFIAFITQAIIDQKLYIQKKQHESIKSIEQQLFSYQKYEELSLITNTIKHDINNYLFVILNTLEQIKGRQNDLELDKLIDNGIISIENARVLIKQMHSISSPEVKKIDLLDMNEFITNFREVLNLFVPSRVKIDYQLDKNIQQIRVSKTHIEQILLNLVINAVQSIKSNGNILIVSSHEQQSNRFRYGYLSLQIRDSGVGVPNNLREKIFEPYYTTKETGTGLGLTTVKNFVKNYNGDIDVTSEEGIGSVFSICIPYENVSSENKGN